MSLQVDVRKSFGPTFALDVSFEVEAADETLALLGPSGCGKSMTLKCIAGIATPDEGRIVLNGRVLFDSEAGVNLRPQERRVGYLFQSYALFPNMTVEQNIAVGVLGKGKEERAQTVARQVAAFRLDGLQKKRPAQLSGGQQQRVALARIMASEPELLLLDEPFSALDGYLRWQLELELTDTLRAFPGGTVYVSHNRDEVYRMCDSVCVISQGRSEQKLSVPELFATPTSLPAALISGCKNVSRARVVGAVSGKKGDGARGAAGDAVLACEEWGVELRTSLPVPADAAFVGLRAHYFTVEAAGKKGEGPAAGDALLSNDAAVAADSAAVPVPAANRIPCAVDRVIDSTFSTIVMLRTPAGGLLRYECGKGEWAALGNPAQVTLGIAPECVMPLGPGKGGVPC